MPSTEESEARLAEVQARIASRTPHVTLAQWWRERVTLAPERVAVRTDAGDLTYRELDEIVRRVAAWGRVRGLRAGDTAALQLPAGPGFLALILGMAELGVCMSLLGTGLRGTSLEHALREVPASLLITADLVGASLEDLVALLDRELGSSPAERDGAAHASAAVRPDDTLFYIFTSGTTGLPKATRCSHGRYLANATSIAVLLELEPDDCTYVVLPMFHIAALVSIGAALSVTASVVVRPKFSASGFWPDVHRFSATTFQYLGEILRYVLAQPPGELDRPNPLRAMIGAGVGESVWRAFEERFGPVRIIESYGSSEGVIGVFNLDGVVGSVGRPPHSVAETLAIVRVDAADGTLARDADGWLVRCGADEPGELIARLDDRAQFEGYSSLEATQRKFLENGFAEGDVWYRSGDLFRQRDGYLYFVARLGDTYRWKGENVSTQQVADVLRGCPAIAHAVVYGVEVPGADGRAGMALLTIAPGAELDLGAVHAQLSRELPAHALPLFMRVGDGAATLTDTYKLGTAELVRQSYAPQRVGDPLFVLDHAAGCYVALTAEALDRLGIAMPDVVVDARGAP